MSQDVSVESWAPAIARAQRPRTTTDYVAGALRRSILNGELEGGKRLNLTDLAQQFEVSTTPVREALRELSFEGLVGLDSYRGGVVTAVTREDVDEIVRIRKVLEPMAIAEAVAGMNPQILAESEAILEEMEESDTWDTWVQGNRSFHRKLYEAASSRRLIGLICSLQDTTVVFVSSTLRKSPPMKGVANDDHRAMIDAARSGDVELLTEITLRHLSIPLTQPT